MVHAPEAPLVIVVMHTLVYMKDNDSEGTVVLLSMPIELLATTAFSMSTVMNSYGIDDPVQVVEGFVICRIA